MSELLVVEGREYSWLTDVLTRMSCGEEVGTHDDLDAIARLLERFTCCERCEAIWNYSALLKAGYEKQGGGI